MALMAIHIHTQSNSELFTKAQFPFESYCSAHLEIQFARNDSDDDFLPSVLSHFNLYHTNPTIRFIVTPTFSSTASTLSTTQKKTSCQGKFC